MKQEQRDSPYILVVEDSPTQREQLKLIIFKGGYKVITAENGNEALAQIGKEKPLMVITDIMMPEMDGYQLCEIIRNNREWADIPVILLTTLSDPGDVIRGLECGADNFVIKPIDVNYLLSRIKHTLTTSELRSFDSMQLGLDVKFGEKRYFITADRIQILNLLLSTYEMAIARNNELKKAKEELEAMNRLIEQKNSKLQEINRELEIVSKTDPLTGLDNRRNMIEKIETEIVRFKRNTKTFSLIIGDVDFFKNLNDTYGHDGGDLVLKMLTQNMRESVREMDSVARWGGEEFLLLLPETDGESGVKLAERIRQKIATHAIRYNDSELKVTMSFGVSCFKKGDSIDETIKRADNALYEGKRLGRNRVVSNCD